jgi:hypothetical protein
MSVQSYNNSAKHWHDLRDKLKLEVEDNMFSRDPVIAAEVLLMHPPWLYVDMVLYAQRVDNDMLILCQINYNNAVLII